MNEAKKKLKNAGIIIVVIFLGLFFLFEIDTFGSKSWGEFSNAIQSGDTGKMKSILEKHPDFLTRSDGYMDKKCTKPDGVTALHLAVEYRNVTSVEFLISQGGNVKAVDNRYDATPLLWSVIQPGTKNRTEIVKILIKAGADPYAKNHSGLSFVGQVQSSGDRSLDELKNMFPGEK